MRRMIVVLEDPEFEEELGAIGDHSHVLLPVLANEADRSGSRLARM